MHLDPSKTEFFIPQRGIQAPKTYTTQANSIYYVPSSSTNALEIVLPPFDRKAARDYEKIPTPQEPILSEELGPSGSSTGSIASEPRPASPISELQGLPVRVPRTPPSTGPSPRVEPPVGNRGDRAIEDLEDLLLKGLLPSKKATKWPMQATRPSEGSPKLLKLAYL